MFHSDSRLNPTNYSRCFLPCLFMPKFASIIFFRREADTLKWSSVSSIVGVLLHLHNLSTFCRMHFACRTVEYVCLL